MNDESWSASAQVDRIFEQLKDVTTEGFLSLFHHPGPLPMSRESLGELVDERDQLRAEVAKLKGPPHGKCDACGFPNNADGTCSRAQCYNSD